MELPQSEPGFLYNEHLQNSRRPAAPCHRIGSNGVRRTGTATYAYALPNLDAGAYGYALSSHAYAISNLDAGADGNGLSDVYAISDLDAGANPVSDVYAISNLDAGANPGGCPPLDIAHGFVPLG